MKLQTVESSMIHAVGYDDRTQTLELIFNSGKIDQYDKVLKQVYEELLAADSKGSYIMHNEVSDCYPYQQVRQHR